MLSRQLPLVFGAFSALIACGSDTSVGPGGANGTTLPDGGTVPSSSSGGTSSGGPPTTVTLPDGGTVTTYPQAKGDPCRGTALSDDAFVPAGMCTRLIASGTVGGLRQIMFAPNGDLFGATPNGNVLLFRDANADGVFSKDEIHIWAVAPGGNGNNAHIDAPGGYVYAGTNDGVVRFPYDPAALKGGPMETVLVNQPTGGHAKHTTHVYDGMLYVHSGSASNQTHESANPIGEYDTTRSLIRSFDLSKFNATKPFDWKTDGTNVAVGLRNAIGFSRNETTKKIYAIVNGLDDILYKSADVHTDNPGEQIVEIAAGKKYGYPFCFTAQRIVEGATVVTPGTQLINQNFPVMDGAQARGDAWCAANSSPPISFFQAHSAPLDVTFFDNYPTGALPEKYRGGAFIALHGSWDRTPATGYKVVWLPFNADGTAPQPTSDMTTTTFPYETVFGGADPATKLAKDGNWQWHTTAAGDTPRPSGVAISPIDGALYISTDSPGALYRVGVGPK